MKTAKEHFDKKYEFYRNFENNPAIPLARREFIFELMESYAKARAVEFALHYHCYGTHVIAAVTPEGLYDDFIKGP